MDKKWLTPSTMLGGSAAGAVLLAAYLGVLAFNAPDPDPPAPTATSPLPAAVQHAGASGPGTPATAGPERLATAATCPTQALSPVRGTEDGRFVLDAALKLADPADPGAFVTVAREAAQEGRLRDAEVALLAACHVAERASGSQSVAVADLKSQIGQQYVAFASGAGADAQREGLLQRAATLLNESAGTYAALLGTNASKTRIAEQRLASLRDPANLQVARGAAAQPSTSVMGAVRRPDDAQEAFAGSRCGGSASRRLICADPELAQLESDMQRLHAQASRVARDPRGMRQRDAHAEARRDSGCQDKGCLLRWYAQRRTQLLREF
jgi:hypothetical protein